jgi:PadR family transcriptional regulator, regulatory protein PadR
MADKSPVRLTRATRRVLLVLLSGASNLSGYVISRAGAISPGAVHVALARLEHAGWVTSEWGAPNPETGLRRRFYQLTGNGHRQAMTLLGLEADSG